MGENNFLARWSVDVENTEISLGLPIGFGIENFIGAQYQH
jgi:hypothetical protein